MAIAASFLKDFFIYGVSKDFFLVVLNCTFFFFFKFCFPGISENDFLFKHLAVFSLLSNIGWYSILIYDTSKYLLLVSHNLFNYYRSFNCCTCCSLFEVKSKVNYTTNVQNIVFNIMLALYFSLNVKIPYPGSCK